MMATKSTGKSVTNSGNYILMEQVVNKVYVYNSGFVVASEDDEGEYTISYAEQNFYQNALEGLRIIDVQVTESSKLTQSPLETGVYVNDFKVRMPRKVTIKGICDNLRGEMQIEDGRFDLASTTVGGYINKIPIAGGAITSIANGIVNEIAGYEYETTQKILSTARTVYRKINDMFTDTSQIDAAGTGMTLPKTWTIATKGAIYTNMILENVEQLNDAEHLMVIPVTLTFVELIMPGLNRDVLFPANDQDADLEMSGHQKKGSWKDRADTFFSDVGDFFS